MTVLSVAAAYLASPAGRRAGSAAFVRAFTPRALDAVAGGSARSRSSGSAASNLISSTKASNGDIRRMFSSAVVRDDDEDEAPLTRMQMSTTVEDDLDAALDDILSGAFQDAGDVAVSDRDEDDAAGTANGAHSVPDALVLTEDFDYRDPKFTNTSNPFWLEAGLSQDVIDVLSHKGIVNLTPVQAEAFCPVVAGRDVIGRSRTGTGKTLAFGLPSVTRLVELAKQKGTMDARGRMQRGRGVSMIVLCPTRELARQVEEELSAISRPLGLYTACFHGGVSYGPQAGAIRSGLDILVGTPGRIMDHLDRGNLDLSECEIAVLDEADEMLNMGFAEDVEVILEGIGSANAEKTQCLLFSATTPPWVQEIGQQYQKDVLSIDSTTQDGDGKSRAATTVKHVALQVPPGPDSKKAILEDIIAVEISKGAEAKLDAMANSAIGDGEEAEVENPIAAAAIAKKKKSGHLNQKIFGKTIVFVETKREADELVSGGVFKSLTAQALHGDVGQKQRDATLAAFRTGAFNVLVATDVAARGIDIKDVDLVIQFEPPRDPDTYVHRSGRTGRAGQTGISVLLFNSFQARNIVQIERNLGHGFKFDLKGPPTTEAALHAVALTSALASRSISDEVAKHFRTAAETLLEDGDDVVDVVARCLASVSRRSAEVESRSLLTGEVGLATIEMTNSRGRNISPGDVMFTISKLARMSQRDENGLGFDGDVGKIQTNPESGAAMFDMGIADAKKLIEFSKDIDAGGSEFKILREMELERGRDFGRGYGGRGGRGGRGGYRGGRGGRGGYGGRGGRGGYQGGGYRRSGNNYHGGSRGGNYENRHGGGGGDRRFRGGGGNRFNGGGGGRYNGGGGGDDGW